MKIDSMSIWNAFVCYTRDQMFSSHTETLFNHVVLTCDQPDLDAQAWRMLWQFYLVTTQT